MLSLTQYYKNMFFMLELLVNYKLNTTTHLEQLMNFNDKVVILFLQMLKTNYKRNLHAKWLSSTNYVINQLNEVNQFVKFLKFHHSKQAYQSHLAFLLIISINSITVTMLKEFLWIQCKKISLM